MENNYIKQIKIACLMAIGLIGHETMNSQTYIQTVQDGNPAVDFVQHSIAAFKENLYVVAGTVVPGAISGNSDILLLVLDTMGNISWSRYIDYGEDEFVGSVMVDADQNIVLTGYKGQNGQDFPNKDLILVKMDSGGNLIDDIIIQDVDNGYSLYGLDLEQTSKGDYIVSGLGASGSAAMAPKYAFALGIDNSIGTILWGRRYESFGKSHEHDSFNHILKIPNHPSYGEVFLLTGNLTL